MQHISIILLTWGAFQVRALSARRFQMLNTTRTASFQSFSFAKNFNKWNRRFFSAFPDVTTKHRQGPVVLDIRMNSLHFFFFMCVCVCVFVGRGDNNTFSIELHCHSFTLLHRFNGNTKWERVKKSGFVLFFSLFILNGRHSLSDSIVSLMFIIDNV